MALLTHPVKLLVPQSNTEWRATRLRIRLPRRPMKFHWDRFTHPMKKKLKLGIAP